MSKAIGSLLRYKKFQTFKEESVNTTKHAVNTNKTIGNLKDVTEYKAVKKRYSTGLNKLMKGFTSGTISKDQANTQFQALAEKHFKEAFSSGQTFIGNPNVTEVPESLDAFLKKGAGTEAGFFKKFLNDLDKYPENADPDGVRKLMNFDKRKTMYEDTLDSMFVNGAITALPDDTPVWWELSPTCIHCPDCIDMSAANPWTVKTLPFIPRSGNTVCFLSGELEIHTIKGLKKLKDIQLNELVLTHKGRYKPVITRTQDLPKKDQFYSGKVYSFILSDDDKHILTPFCLPTHRYFDINADWVEAKNLQKYDYISTLILIDELVLYHEWVIETINIKEIKNKRIWSIGVKEDESFILANGVVSHNCLSKCCCNLRIGERDDAGEAPAGAIKASTKVPNRRDGSIPSVQVKEELNTLTSEMNYHRQMAEAIKKGRNYQDLAKDEKDLISFHLSKRKELNARIIELNADQRTKSIPQFSVKDLTGQVNEMQKQGYDLVYSPLETLAAGDDVAGLSNTLIDVGTVNVVDSATGSIGINSVSRGNIELLYERSLFYRKPVLQINETTLPDTVQTYLNNLNVKLSKNKDRSTNLLTVGKKVLGETATNNDIERQLIKNIDKWKGTKNIVVRVPQTTVERVIDSGRFKSQFETGLSEGIFDPEYRLKVEKSFFSYPSDLAISERPIYGTFLNSVDDYDNTAIRYGNSVFVLKDEVKSRTTVTWNNSFAYNQSKAIVGNPMPINAKNSYINTVSEDQLETILKGKIDSFSSPYSYTEAQFHGGLSMEDVKELRLYYNSNNYSTASMKAFVANLQAKVSFPIRILKIEDN